MSWVKWFEIVKSLHIIFIISWFAGLFYLPRIFVNLAMAETDAERARLNAMARKLYRFMTPLGVLALAFGVWLWLGYGFAGGWLTLKLALTAILVLFNVWCGRIVQRFAAGSNTHSHVWYRWFNEVPTLVMFAVIFLVVLKPF
jgi:putative membrane protein